MFLKGQDNFANITQVMPSRVEDGIKIVVLNSQNLCG
jgi:hypothetical protein